MKGLQLYCSHQGGRCALTVWCCLQVKEEGRAQEVLDLAQYERSEELRKAKSRSKKNHSRFTVLRRHQQVSLTGPDYDCTRIGIGLTGLDWNAPSLEEQRSSELYVKFCTAVIRSAAG